MGAPLSEVAAKRGVSGEQLLTTMFSYPRPSPAILKCKTNISLDADMHARLLEEAFRQKVHHAELIRQFIEWGLEQCQP